MASKNTPALPAGIDANLRRTIEKMAEVTDTGAGNRGRPEERYLRVSDLIDLGLAKRLSNNAQRLVSGVNIISPVRPILDIPPRPDGFEVVGGLGVIFLSWVNARLIYGNHAYTEIYRAEEDNLANAVLIQQATDSFGALDESATYGTEYFYWIRFVSTADIKGPWNDAAGTTGKLSEDPAILLEMLTEQITKDQLHIDLRTPIDLIDAPDIGLVQQSIDNAEAISNEITARQAAVSAEASTRAAAIIAEAEARGAAISEEATTRQSADDSLASSIATLTASVGTNAAAITTEAATRATAVTAEATARDTLAAQLRGSYTGTDINSLTTGLLYNERVARTTQEGAFSSQLALLSAGNSNQFDHAEMWYFDTGIESWTGNGTPTIATTGWLRPANHASDPYAQSPVISVAGGVYPQVRARIKKTGSPTWEGRLSYIITGDATWGPVKSVTVSEPTYSAGVGLLTWDMSGAWLSGTITAIRVELSADQDASNYFEIDWVAIGRPAPGASSAELYTEQLARTTADSALASDIATANAAIAGKASTTALNALDARVTSTEGVNTSQATQLTNLRASMFPRQAFDNCDFGDWTGSYPAGWASWSTTTGFSKHTGSYAYSGGAAMQFVTNATDDLGSSFTANTAKTFDAQYFDIEMIFTVTAGTSLSGAGLLLDWVNVDSSVHRASLKLKDLYPDGTFSLDKKYVCNARLSKPGSTGTFSRMRIYFMANYNSNGLGAKTAKTLIVDYLAVTASDVSASAVASLDARVTSTETTNTSQATQITNLQTDVAGKASSAALSALDSRVTTAEGSITSQSSSITVLNSAVDSQQQLQWTRTYSVNSSTTLPLLWYNGAALPTGSSGVRREFVVTGVTGPTGTVTKTIARFYWDGAAWQVQQLSNLGQTSNHPVFLVSSGVPAVRTNHASFYTVTVVAEDSLWGGYGAANAIATSALTTRVDATEDSITAISSDITNLQASIPGGNNLILNSEFANGTNGWVALATSNVTGVTSAVNQGTAILGVNHYGIDLTFTTTGGYVIHRTDYTGIQKIPVIPGFYYSASCYMAGSNSAVRGRVYMEFLNSSNTGIGTVYSNILALADSSVTTIGEMTRIGVVGLAPAGSAHVRIGIICSTTTTGAKTFKYTRAMFAEVPTLLSDIPVYESGADSAVSAAIRITAEAAVTSAASAQSTANSATSAASAAQTSANTANTAVAAIADDNILTPVEKSSIRLEWNVIAAEKTVNDTQADAFSVSKTAYGTAFQALATYLNAGTTWTSGIPSWISDANLATNTTIVGATFRTNFKAYYDARTALLNAIATKAKTLADAAQSTGNSAVARWEVKTTVGDLTGGVGFYNDGVSTKFAIHADQFSVFSPGASAFGLIIDGARVVMDGALIKDATVKTAQIENAAITAAKIGTAAINDLQVGTLTVDKIIQTIANESYQSVSSIPTSLLSYIPTSASGVPDRQYSLLQSITTPTRTRDRRELLSLDVRLTSTTTAVRQVRYGILNLTSPVPAPGWIIPKPTGSAGWFPAFWHGVNNTSPTPPATPANMSQLVAGRYVIGYTPGGAISTVAIVKTTWSGGWVTVNTGGGNYSHTLFVNTTWAFMVGSALMEELHVYPYGVASIEDEDHVPHSFTASQAARIPIDVIPTTTAGTSARTRYLGVSVATSSGGTIASPGVTLDSSKLTVLALR